MSGHSKWSTIKRKKGAEDAKRSKIFTRLARDIIVAVKEGGGGDMEMNPRLKLAVDKAKAANMPKDNIQRAIDKGTGNADDGTVMEEVTYEGYGPGGVALLVETITDNRNRTLAEVKNAFNRGGGSMGSAGTVQWQFDQKGFIQITNGAAFDEVFLVAADAGAEDVVEEDGEINVYTAREDLYTVVQALVDQGYQLAESALIWVPQNEIELSPEEAVKVLKLVERLEDLDDVDAVSSNLSITDAAMAAYANA